MSMCMYYNLQGLHREKTYPDYEDFSKAILVIQNFHLTEYFRSQIYKAGLFRICKGARLREEAGSQDQE